MALGGGYFKTQNKVLPGAYINFVARESAVAVGARGVACLPLALDWGRGGEMLVLTGANFAGKALAELGYDMAAAEVWPVREALKRAHTVKVWRLNAEGGAKASGTIGGIVWTAKCAGVRGNSLKGAVQVCVDDDTKFDVMTYMDGAEVDRQRVGDAGELEENEFVAFGAGTLAAEAAAPLAGGVNGEVNGQSFSAFLEKAEVEPLNTVGYTGEDETTKAMLAAFAVRMNEEEGRMIQCVVADYAAGHEAVLNVKNGVVLADGQELSAAGAVAWVTGAVAGAEVNESLTGSVYEGAVDAVPRLTKSECEDAVKKGEFVFCREGTEVRVLSELNSLTPGAAGKNDDMRHNRVWRAAGAFASDCTGIFTSRYLGKVTNNDTSRQLFKADLVKLADEYRTLGAVEAFDADDITVEMGASKRDIVVTCALVFNDSMEKMYMTIYIG